MVADTFDNILRTFCKTSPFVPFVVELVSGNSFTVRHPEALAYHDGTAVYIAPGGRPHLFDHESVSRLSGAPDDQS